MDNAFRRGVVLLMSFWDDHDVYMQWLDRIIAQNSIQETSMKIPCDRNGGDPYKIENKYPYSNVRFSNIRIGEIV